MISLVKPIMHIIVMKVSTSNDYRKIAVKIG